MKDTIETRIGMFFVLAIMAAFVILELLGSFDFLKRGYHLHALFTNVQELKVGDPVKMGGVPVGRVENIKLADSLAEVTMNLDRSADVKVDSKAMVKFAGLLGQNYVSLSFSTNNVKADEGATLQTEEEPDLSDMMVKIDSVATGVENLTKSFSGEQIEKLLGPLTDFVKNNQSNLSATIANFRITSDNIAQGRGTVGRLINDDQLYVTALGTVSNMQNTASELRLAALDARTLLGNVNNTVNQVKSGQGTLGKLITDDSLFRASTSVMTNANHILEKIDHGNGTVGQLINDDSTLRNLKLSMQKVDKATESLEDTGPLSILGTIMSSLF